MVKVVIGEETRMNVVEDRLFQSRISVQVGLVIGKINSGLDRGFVYDLVPTPDNDHGEAPCTMLQSGKEEKKKGSRGKSQLDSPSLIIDHEWVAEHARQVSKMLLGGIKVVGVYVWSTEGSFKASSSILWQTIRTVAKTSCYCKNDLDEGLLIHISYSPKRWSCRPCTLRSTSAPSTLQLCDFKLGKLLGSLRSFRCMYNFELRLPVSQENSLRSTLKDIISRGITHHAKELKDVITLVDGKLLNDELESALDHQHEVELLRPFMKGSSLEACSTEEIVGLIVVRGTIFASSYLCPREPISQALSDIKDDIVTSLHSRLDIICDETETMEASSIDHIENELEIPIEISIQQFKLSKLRKLQLSFPRRVLIPWLPGVHICDYLQSSNVFEDVKDHCREMMSMEMSKDTSEIIEVETEAASVSSKSFWDVVQSSTNEDTSSRKASEKSSIKNQKQTGTFESLNFNIFFLVILILSIIIALVFKSVS